MKTSRIAALIAALVLILAACGGSDSTREAPQIDGSADAAPLAASDDEATHDDDEATHDDDEATHDDDEATHDDDEATHDDDEATHDDDEATHDDDEATHDDDEATHDDDEATHDDDEAAHSDEYVPAAEGAPTAEFDVVLGDIFFESTAVEVTTGQTVRFNLVNDGVIDHEFRLSNGHRIEEHIAVGHEDHGEGGHHGDRDIVVTLTPGESRTVDVTFPADTTLFTEIACLIPGHYEAGMKAPITYQ